MRIGGKITIIVFSVVGVVILLLACVILFRERPPTYEAVLTPESRVAPPSVLNLETGEVVPIETAMVRRMPYIGIVSINQERVAGDIWTAVTSGGYMYGLFLRVSGVDVEFAPVDASDKPLRDYWADKDSRQWPAFLSRQTSAYTWLVAPENQPRGILFRTFGGTTGVLRISAMDESSAKVRCRIVGKSSSGGRAAPESRAALIARWPEGAGVEIVGLTRHPSTAESEWWRADGTPLARPPCLVQQRAWADQNDVVAYEIAYRFLSLDREYVRGFRARVPACLGTTAVGAYDEFSRLSLDCGVQAFRSAQETQSTAVEFGLATGEWQTVLTTRDGGETEQGDLGVIRISPPEEIKHDVAVTVTIARAWADTYAWRLVALGEDGQPLEVRMVSRNATEAAALPLEQYRFKADRRWSEIKEFRLDVCPYRWRWFRNVSLRPGQDFGVQLESP